MSSSNSRTEHKQSEADELPILDRRNEFLSYIREHIDAFTDTRKSVRYNNTIYHDYITSQKSKEILSYITKIEESLNNPADSLNAIKEFNAYLSKNIKELIKCPLLFQWLYCYQYVILIHATAKLALSNKSLPVSSTIATENNPDSDDTKIYPFDHVKVMCDAYEQLKYGDYLCQKVMLPGLSKQDAYKLFNYLKAQGYNIFAITDPINKNSFEWSGLIYIKKNHKEKLEFPLQHRGTLLGVVPFYLGGVYHISTHPYIDVLYMPNEVLHNHKPDAKFDQHTDDLTKILDPLLGSNTAKNNNEIHNESPNAKSLPSQNELPNANLSTPQPELAPVSDEGLNTKSSMPNESLNAGSLAFEPALTTASDEGFNAQLSALHLTAMSYESPNAKSLIPKPGLTLTPTHILAFSLFAGAAAALVTTAYCGLNDITGTLLAEISGSTVGATLLIGLLIQRYYAHAQPEIQRNNRATVRVY